METSKAVFLDRDGTINVDVHYLNTADNFRMYPGVGEGTKRLQDAGFKIIIITNQSGLARGYFTLETLGRIHERMITELKELGVRVDGVYFCPHHPDDGCGCRKPRTGMLRQAMEEHKIHGETSFMIGDKILDVVAGKRIGARTILIPEPHTREEMLKERDKWQVAPDFLADDFPDAVDWILGN